MQFVSSTKIEKKMHFENLIDHFLAFSTKSVPNYCMRFPATQKLHNPGIFVWAFVLSCLWLRGKLFSTSFSTNCVMSTLSDSFDSCNYTKRNHNLSDYKKGGLNKNSGLNIVSDIFQHRVAVLAWYCPKSMRLICSKKAIESTTVDLSTITNISLCFVYYHPIT